MPVLEELAVELDRRARQVDATGDRLVREAATALWSSVAADAFRAQVARRRAECADAARALQLAASGMRAFAAGAEAERRRLEHLAELATDAIGALGVPGGLGALGAIGRAVGL